MAKLPEIVILTAIHGGYIVTIDGGEKREISVEEYDRLTGKAPVSLAGGDPEESELAQRVKDLEGQVKTLTDAASEKDKKIKDLEGQVKTLTDAAKPAKPTS